MIVAAIQFCPTFKDVAANIARIEAWVQNTEADVIVFPELATCGYFFLSEAEARPFALRVADPMMQRIIHAAERAGRYVVCGFAEDAGNVLYNSALVTGPSIKPTVYRKTHLFYKEHQVFAPGNTGFSTVHLPKLDCSLGTMICYDWRFPESARTLALKGADLIVCPSNLITGIWRQVMPVRAIENKVFVLVSNRTGSEANNGEHVDFNGLSAIYSYNGKPLAETDAENDAVIMAEIHPEKTRDKSFNAVNDIFADRRPEFYD